MHLTLKRELYNICRVMDGTCHKLQSWQNTMRLQPMQKADSQLQSHHLQ